MTKRKHISDTRLAEIEKLCQQPEDFFSNGKSPEELRQLHQELNCLIDAERLHHSVVPGAKVLRYNLKQRLQQLASA